MTPVSLTGVGAIITLAQFALRWFGIEIADDAVSAAINGLVTFVGVALLIVGQIRRKDLKFGLIRR